MSASIVIRNDNPNVYHIIGNNIHEICEFFINIVEDPSTVVACDLQYSEELRYEIVFYINCKKGKNSNIQFTYQLDSLTFGDLTESTKALIFCIRKMGFSDTTISDQQLQNSKSKLSGLYFCKMDCT